MLELSKKNLTELVIFFAIIIIFAFSNQTIFSILAQLMLVTIMLFSIIKSKEIKLNIYFFWMLSFIFWGLFISLFAYDIETSTTSLINMALKFLFYTSLIIYIDSEEKILFILKSIVIAGLILMMRVIIFTPSNEWGTERLGGALDLNANILGVIMAYTGICAIYLSKKLNQKYLYLLVVPLIIVGLLTGSRKAFFMIIGGFSLLIFLSIKKKRNFIIALLFITIFIISLYTAAMNIPLIYNILGYRLEGLGFGTNSDVDASSRTRSYMVEEALKIFNHNPFVGVGLENFQLLSRFGTYSHNNYMEILSSTGIIGLIIYYSLPVLVLISSIFNWLKKEKQFNFIIVVLSVVLVMDYGMVTYNQLITQVMILLSISYYLILLQKKSLGLKNALES